MIESKFLLLFLQEQSCPILPPLPPRPLTPSLAPFPLPPPSFLLPPFLLPPFLLPHFPSNNKMKTLKKIFFCRWNFRALDSSAVGPNPTKIFGFVARKISSRSDNACHVFAEFEPEQPASAIVNFVTKVMMAHAHQQQQQRRLMSS